MAELHRPKLVKSTEGIGLPENTRSLAFFSDSLALGVEVWNKVDDPWHQDDIVTALPGYKWLTIWEAGKPYVITKYYDDKANLIGVYCDICRPVERVDSGFEFFDLYLDVWMVPGQAPVILDEDELKEALEAGYVTKTEADQASLVAQVLVRTLTDHPEIATN